MPAKDLYHNTVKTALIKDGWTITDNPLTLAIGERDLYIDLGAEKLLIADRGSQKIAVEVKSFISASPVRDLENALGQYILYEDIIAEECPERILYLAVREEVYLTFFSEPIVQIPMRKRHIKVLIFDEIREVITQWIS
ncbi:element excision factor XisH family protein [Phormidesmis sp. 146-33]